MYRRILVPTDGSRGARHAMQAAAELARLSGANVIAMHVVEPPVAEVSYMGLGVIGAPVSVGGGAEPAPLESDRALLEARHVAETAGVAFEPRQVYAPRTAGAIVELAESEGCDLIVMASGGYGDLLSIVTGSVTARVVSGCDLPVLVVH